MNRIKSRKMSLKIAQLYAPVVAARGGVLEIRRYWTNDTVNASDPAPGTCMRADGYKLGVRPLCWFKPPAEEIPAMSVGILKVFDKEEGPAFSSLKSDTPWQGF